MLVPSFIGYKVIKSSGAYADQYIVISSISAKHTVNIENRFLDLNNENTINPVQIRGNAQNQTKFSNKKAEY